MRAKAIIVQVGETGGQQDGGKIVAQRLASCQSWGSVMHSICHLQGNVTPGSLWGWSQVIASDLEHELRPEM